MSNFDGLHTHTLSTHTLIHQHMLYLQSNDKYIYYPTTSYTMKSGGQCGGVIFFQAIEKKCRELDTYGTENLIICRNCCIGT